MPVEQSISAIGGVRNDNEPASFVAAALLECSASQAVSRSIGGFARPDRLPYHVRGDLNSGITSDALESNAPAFDITDASARLDLPE